jgi:hypothetical protein
MDPYDQPPTHPMFASAAIAKRYQDGHITRLDAELADILQTQQEPLNCVAIICAGEVIPIFDLTIPQQPTTIQERLAICQHAARALIDILAAILEQWKP